MKGTQADREVIRTGTLVCALVAMVLAFAALVTAAQAYSRSSDAKKRVDKLASSGVLGSTSKVTLEEFTITPHPGLVKSGKVTLDVDNVGSITHELVLVRASSVASLPLVKTAGERAVGAIDEEAITEADTIGETGDVPAGSHVAKTFDLTPGTYVMFCNIDNKNSDGTTLNHFTRGMSATLIVV